LSFERAVKMGVDMIELDVHVCSSGELVVIHDDTVNRTTDGTGRISDMALGELRALDAGNGQRIPLLKEVLDRFQGRTALNIELKGKGTALPVWESLDEELKEGRWIAGDLLVSSFRPDELFEFSEVSEGIRTGYIFEDHPDMGLEFAGGAGAWSIHPKVDLVDGELISRARSKHLKILVWTVNDRTSFQDMVSLGIDGVFTDRPDVCIFHGQDK
jgi:glycerophosphoryl diester phosphodiesterase